MREPARTYWRSLEELADSPQFAAFVEKEAPRFRDVVNAFDRRRFLQLMAASMALGGLSGCGPEPNQRQLLPYVEQPENIIPGRNRYYSGATIQDGYATGVLLAHQMARPIKVEGNPDHPASLGAASAIMQASILELYDPRRAQTIFGDGRIAPWEDFVRTLHARRGALSDGNGEGLRILTGAVTSPSLAAQMAKLRQQFPAMRWHQWEPLHRDSEHASAARSFNQNVDRTFDVAKADRILGIESDLISATPGWLAYARHFAAARRPAENGGSMSRVYAIESTPTLLGAKADHRLAIRPDEIPGALRYLAGLLGAGPQTWSQAESRHSDWLRAAADDLDQHKGKALVHAGREQPVEVHLLADAINAKLDAFGNTVKPIASVEAMPGSKRQSLVELADDMASGKVDTLLIMGANPVYDAPADLDFAGRLRHVPFSVSVALYEDETAVACKWRIPAAHVFETWGDARAFDGTVTIMQPQVRPMYAGRAPQEILGVLLGDSSADPYALLRDYWRRRVQQENRGDFEEFWHGALQRGIVADTAQPALSIKPTPDAAVEEAPATASPQPPLQALFRPDEGLWDGRHAHNPWLLEMARAFTRLTWDNAALLAPSTAKRLGVDTHDVVEISIEKAKLRAPVFVLPGQAPDCITLPLGWGRTADGLGAKSGFNAYTIRHSGRPWVADVSALVKTGETDRLATTQNQDRVIGRDLIREGDLAEFNSDPGKIVKQKKAESLYQPFDYPDRAWAMTVDLNSCIGCQACTIACQAENNVPIVGKDQVLAGRVMHWLRVDRYYSGSTDAPEMAFEPMPCMHCEQAPCEVVCPVHATVHDHEGLNLMVYNRCVGTRFCSNNCPYKVRRFNFYGYAEENERAAESWNPEVTVRGRGVMEKCTYCIQRIRTVQIDAEKEDRKIADGEVRTACQQSCPTQAIIFGDRNDKGSAVAGRKAWPIDYALLDDLNTRPRTTYSALIRNPNPAIKTSASQHGETTSHGDDADE
ncbi:TAT-variant-translocated molybdopterin oxidoreductase [Bradyrhizobium diazoefficiens]|nr:TAT-variant-translocated molybdopterin oxidoreductase [Bradyrhizobium diazoefficiens]QQO23440.1 TAT-variant-translocated molybdopterin oxidoreductase [Bradyrhizobium diazoefficiens]